MANGKQSKEKMIEQIVDDVINQNIYLVGTSSSGPTNTPTKIDNLQQAIRLFGDTGSLIEAYQAIHRLPKTTSVYFVKTTGTHGMVRLHINELNGGILKDAFYFKSKQADEDSNHVMIQFSERQLEIHHPATLGGHVMTYRYSDFPSLGELVGQINQDAQAGYSAVFAQTDAPLQIQTAYAFHTCNPQTVYLAGASNGLNLNKDYYYYCLEDTYRVLEGELIDLIVPIDAYFDDFQVTYSLYGQDTYGEAVYASSEDLLTLKQENRPLTYYEQLIRFCYLQMQNGIWTHGVMGCRPIGKEVALSVDSLMQSYEVVKSNNLYRDYSYLVSVVFGDLYYDFYQREAGAYLAYASLISQLEAGVNACNQLSHESLALKTILNPSMIESLADLGFVVYRESLIHQTPTAHNATTLHQMSDMKYFANVQMAQQTVRAIQQLADVYVGRTMNGSLSQSQLREELENLLRELAGRNILSEYSLSVETVDQSEIQIRVALLTHYMTEEIVITGGVAFQL